MGTLMAGPAAGQRLTPRREDGDGQQEIGGLRRIGRIGGGLRRALRGDETGIAILPALQLAIEEGAARRVIGEREQVVVQAGNEAGGTVRWPRIRRLGIVPAGYPALLRRHSTAGSRLS